MSKKNGHKPNKGLLKRIKRTASGKIKIRRPGAGHLLSVKTGKRRRKFRRALVTAKCECKRMAAMMGLR